MRALTYTCTIYTVLKCVISRIYAREERVTTTTNVARRDIRRTYPLPRYIQYVIITCDYYLCTLEKDCGKKNLGTPLYTITSLYTGGCIFLKSRIARVSQKERNSSYYYTPLDATSVTVRCPAAIRMQTYQNTIQFPTKFS